MAYAKLNWQNLQTTPLNSENLNHMDNGIYQNSQDIITVENKLTTNMLKPTLQTTTSNGITCTNNGDGTYTIQPGTASGKTVFSLGSHQSNIYKGMKCTACPSGGSDSGYYLYVGYYKDDTSNGVTRETGNGVILSTDQSNNNIWFAIVIESGIVISTPLIFKPMVTTNLSATYDDFVPYTGTSGQLNKDVADIKKDLETTKTNLSNKYALISGTLGSATGYRPDTTYPTGFTKNNTMVVSVEVQYSTGEYANNLVSGNVVLAVVMNDSKIQVYQYSTASNVINQAYKICLMRTDI